MSDMRLITVENFYSEESLRQYVEKCFKKAFMSEGRQYDPQAWRFEYILIKNKKGVWQLIPVVFWCTFARVQRYVDRMLNNNLRRIFDIHYRNSDELGYLIYDDGDFDKKKSGQIDYNHTEAMFKYKRRGKMIMSSLSVIDKCIDDEPIGETGIAWRYEKLLFKYWGITADQYRSLPEDDEKSHLPYDLCHDWKKYWELYVNTFGEEPGAKYEVICSSGIERITNNF